MSNAWTRHSAQPADAISPSRNALSIQHFDDDSSTCKVLRSIYKSGHAFDILCPVGSAPIDLNGAFHAGQMPTQINTSYCPLQSTVLFGNLAGSSYTTTRVTSDRRA
jgi:hypothetical protein